MNIVLIGYRGTGKTVTAGVLAERLDRPRVVLDEAIEHSAGMSIPEIVERHGWPYFRDLETEETRRVGGRDGLIVDCGGGVVERPENMESLNERGVVFWLKAPVDVIVSRIESGTGRPPLTEGRSFTEEVEEVLARRNPLYAEAADYQIETAGKSPGEVAEEILELLNLRGP